VNISQPKLRSEKFDDYDDDDDDVDDENNNSNNHNMKENNFFFFVIRSYSGTQKKANLSFATP